MNSFRPKSLALLLILGLSSPLQAGQPAYVAGKFYPADKHQLETDIAKYMQGSGMEMGHPRILLVPHAGYEFSGSVAGRAFREIQKKTYEVVIILGTAHQKAVTGAVLDPEGEFETPLGKAAVDAETSLRLLTLSKKILPDPAAFQNEHSVEATLPFIQQSLLYFKIVPLLMSVPDLPSAKEIGEAIATVMKENELKGRRTLLVISSDLSHYPSQEYASLSDNTVLKQIETVNPEGLFQKSQELLAQSIPNLVTTMCGEAGMLAGLYAAQKMGIKKASIVSQATSADSAQGDANKVVGYASALFYDAPAEEVKAAPIHQEKNPVLTDAHKKDLLKASRQVLQEYLETGEARTSLKIEDEVLNKPRAVFVTLRKNGELRGCVGTTFPKFPLKQGVLYYATAAATQDSRFPPVKKEELKDLKIEISILSSQKPVPGPEAVKEGDGVIMLLNGKHGLLLPEVWKEFKFTKDQFMAALAEKAGLPADSWKNPATKFFIFSTDTFAE